MQDLTGKYALVTGASSGIGQAIAITLARAGARLALTGRDHARLEQTAAKAMTACDTCQAAIYTAELTEDEEVARLCEQVSRQRGPLDLLIHAAGIAKLGSIADTPTDLLRDTLAINTVAPYQLTHCLLPDLIKSRGSVVFINSRAGFKTLPTLSHYCASKFALKAIADTLRQEVAPRGVRVMSVYPGKVATPMQEDIHVTRGKPYHPEEFPAPESVAELVLNSLCMPADTVVADVVIQPRSEAT
jgi:short-subunit dehydrogenase